jgi:hypothetical protein
MYSGVPLRPDGAVVAALDADLLCEDHLVTVRAKRAADQLTVLERAVQLSAVDEDHTDVDGVPQFRDRLRIVARPI